MAQRLPWTPDWAPQGSHQPRVRSVNFGDGYQQDQVDGLNADLPTWEVIFSNRTKAEADAIEAFLRARGGADRFLFKIPDSDYSVSGHGFGVGDGSTAVFQLQRTRVTTVMDALGTYAKPTTPNTNYLRYSQDLNNGAWSLSGASIAAEGAVAPDGNLTAEVLTSTGTDPWIAQSVTLQPGTYCLSMWVRGAGSSVGKTCRIWAWFNGTATGATGGGGQQGIGSGWTRVSETFTVTSGGTLALRLDIPDTGAAASDAVHIWGAQANPGSTASPYIYTTTAAVTVNPSYYPSTTDGFEAVMDAPVDLVIYVAGVAKARGADYSVSATGAITLTVAPAAGAALTWSGSGADW
ncbi:MAG TPA: phage tail protein, partial [Geothrix sp.]|nr:phage tail protein [Geothrix sp.]